MIGNIDTDGLSSFWPLFEGHLRDVIGSNDGALVNSHVDDWCRNSNILGYRPANSNGVMQVPHHSSVNVSDSFTLAILFDAFNKPKRKVAAYYPRIFSKRNLTGTNLDVYFFGSAGNVPYLCSYDGSSQSTFASFLSTGLWRTLFLTKESGNNNPKAYRDGIFVQNGNASQSITADTSDLYIGNNYAGSQPSNSSVQAILLYNGLVKTGTQIKQIHESLVSVCTPTVGTKRFYSIPGSQKDYQDLAVFSELQNEVIADASENGLVGQVSGGSLGGIKNVLMPYGGNGQKFVGNGTNSPSSQAMFDFDVATALGYTTQTFGGWCIFIPHRTGYFHRIVNRGIFSSDGWTFEVSNADLVRCSTHQSGANQSTSGATALVAGKAYWLGWLSVAGDKNYVYIELVDDSSSPVSRTNPTYNAARDLNYGAQAGVYGVNGVVSELEVGEFSNKADYEAQAALAYRQIAQSIMYRGDYYLLAENPAVFGAGRFIKKAESGLKVLSGTHKVIHQQVLGGWKKIIECVTAGRISIPHLAINSAYGTWDVLIYKGAAGNSPAFDFVADAQDPSSGYYIYSNGSNNNLILQERSVGALYTSANDVISAQTWFRLRITRNVLGTFNIYLDDVFLGTATDTTVDRSSFMSLDLDAGDRFVFGDRNGEYSLTKFWGVLTP